jgi:protein SCO1
MRIIIVAAASLALLAAAAQPRLVDQSGHAFTLASLRGEPLVVTFVSAHCTDACPLINGQFADAARRIAQAHLTARLLTITLDPEHDSVATMRALARRFEADPRYWLVAGGAPADVHRIMRAFGVVAIQGKRGYADQHTTFVYVFDRSGAFVKTMLASTDLSGAIVDEIGAQRLAVRR